MDRAWNPEAGSKKSRRRDRRWVARMVSAVLVSFLTVAMFNVQTAAAKSPTDSLRNTEETREKLDAGCQLLADYVASLSSADSGLTAASGASKGGVGCEHLRNAVANLHWANGSSANQAEDECRDYYSSDYCDYLSAYWLLVSFIYVHDCSHTSFCQQCDRFVAIGNDIVESFRNDGYHESTVGSLQGLVTMLEDLCDGCSGDPHPGGDQVPTDGGGSGR